MDVDLGPILTLTETAEMIRKPVATLRYWRHRGEGPRSFKVGSTVVYAEADVRAWIAQQRDAAPTLTGEQRDRRAGLLRPAGGGK